MMKVMVTRASDLTSKPIYECYLGKDNNNNIIWFLDVEDMSELMDIVTNYGPVLIYKGKKYLHVKIYDDYMEQ